MFALVAAALVRGVGKCHVQLRARRAEGRRRELGRGAELAHSVIILFTRLLEFPAGRRCRATVGAADGSWVGLGVGAGVGIGAGLRQARASGEV